MQGYLEATPALQSRVAILAQHLERCAADYYGESGETRIRLERKQLRRNATLYYFDAPIGETRHSIVVKVPFGRRQATDRHRRSLPDELRVCPLSTDNERGPLEHATLARIQRHFAARPDPRFGAIRVLDYVPEVPALVMEHCPDRNLDDLFSRRSHLLRPFGSTRLDAAMRNAGAWLRAFHALPATPDGRERSPLRSDFLGSVDRMVEYLCESDQAPEFLESLRHSLHADARAALPERLPLATLHGDAVPRNVLVRADNRVTIFDTRAEWQAPIYEDIARFRVALVACNSQMASQGRMFDRAELELYGAEFLDGYFEAEPAPLRAIQLFECQRLLAIWVAAAYQHRSARGLRKMRKACVLELRGRYLKRQLESVLGKMIEDE